MQPSLETATDSYLRQLGWREFAYHLLFHFPETPEQPLNARFNAFPWRENYDQDLNSWQRGQTGIPIVDAGMRELWQTGWMHNRVRMIVASLLCKNLLIPWQEGAHWFWDTLVDADLANNTLGWQWVAGCGADAAPYFRVFNPVLQGEKFDKNGHYVRHWVPELARMPSKWIHAPWRAPTEVLNEAGIALGSHYPHPIVDLAGSRTRALQAWDAVKSSHGDK
jgi:deoxyribodipyrimidine photo-lyase